MPFLSLKQASKLEARIAALEAKLGIGVEIPEIEHVLSLHDIYGDDIAELLILGGKVTPLAVETASDEELLAVNGIGPATVKRIRKAGQ